jgi:hypothetical protein
MTYFQRRSAKQHQHRYFVDLDTHDTVCLCGKLHGSKKAAPGKYNAPTTIYKICGQTQDLKDLWSKICGQKICGQRFVVRRDWNFARSGEPGTTFLKF